MVNKLYFIVMVFLLSGCANKLHDVDDAAQKEYILTQLHDYQGLIGIYRDKLSVNDNPADRYHLAELYNKVGDYRSSDIYLKPLVEKNSNDKYSLLQVKNLLELGREDECEPILSMLLEHNEANGELWNLQGVMFAQQGNYAQAQVSFEKARSFFYDEESVINNIAMMAILQQDYTGARNYLLPLYAKKEHRRQTVYNLVYALVKANDEEDARKIITAQQLSSDNPEALIRSLRLISPRNQYNHPVADTKREVVSEQSPQIKKETISEITPVDSVSGEHPSAPTECTATMDNIGKPAKYSGGASLNSKNISGLTSASIKSGTRLALYSVYPLNYRVLPQQSNNQIEIELFNSRPLNALYSAQLNIIKKRPEVSRIEFVDGEHNSVILKVVTNKCISARSIKRAKGNKKFKEKIIIDFHYS